MALLKRKSEDAGDNPPGQEANRNRESQTAGNPPVNRPHIDKEIDDYAAANPKYLNYLNSLSKERLVRMLLLEDLRATQAKQNLNRGFHQFAVSNPALVEAIKEIRATISPEEQDRHIARLGKTFAISTNARVKPIRPDAPEQSGPKVSH